MVSNESATAEASGPAEPSWRSVLGSLIAGQNQSSEATSWAMGQILTGSATSAQIAAFVIALRTKGETVEEVTGLAQTMLDLATPIDPPGPAVDVVGTGGDRANTVNISTMAAMVTAAAGARVVKHGNRAASSACGAADLLEELGVVLDLSPDRQVEVIERVGIGFLFAPAYHPALRYAAATRRELGVPTTFNFLGPLTNPGRPDHQAVGVADARMAELMAGVLARRGNSGLVFHGGDGLDELTTTTTSTVWCYSGGQVEQTELDPADLGLARSSIADLVGGDAASNAAVARELLDGRTGPIRDIVLLNAAAALTALDGPEPSRLGEQLGAAIERAAAAIDSGAAADLLQRWIEASQQLQAA